MANTISRMEDNVVVTPLLYLSVVGAFRTCWPGKCTLSCFLCFCNQQKGQLKEKLMMICYSLQVSYIVPGSAYITSGHDGTMPVTGQGYISGIRLTLHYARFLESIAEFYYMVPLKCCSSYIIALIKILINKFCSLRSPLSNLLIRISIKAIMKESSIYKTHPKCWGG